MYNGEILNTCRTDYRSCKYYHPEQELESRCMTDSTVSHCEEEKKVIQWIDNYFEEYDSSEIEKDSY